MNGTHPEIEIISRKEVTSSTYYDLLSIYILHTKQRPFQ